MSSIGKIYGEVVDNSFSFCSKDIFDGQYVKIKKNEEEKKSPELICEIVKRGIINKYVTTPQVINYLDDRINYNRDTIYTYYVSPIGTLCDNRIVENIVSAIPGKNVYSVEPNELCAVYGITDEGIKIGTLKKQKKCNVKIIPDKIFNPHLFVVGRTGSGKSYFIKKLMKNIGCDFWVFSPSDEYDNSFDDSVCINKDVVLELNIDSLSYYFGLNASEESILRKIAFDKEKIYSCKEICEEVYKYFAKKSIIKEEQLTFDFSNSEISQKVDVSIPNYGNSLIAKMKGFRHLRFTNNKKIINVSLESVVYNLEKYSQVEQECIINFFLFQLFVRKKNAKNGNAKKQIVVIEEAHNFISSQKNSLSKDILVRLSREGRKYGISLCFITQRPRFFDQTALSQSGNKIIFSLPNPDDVKHITEEVTYYRPDLAINIQKQKVGECIIIGDVYNDILEVRIDS